MEGVSVYPGPMSLLRLHDDLPALAAPVLVGAFDGWIDAGGAASGAADRLAEGSDRIAAVDADARPAGQGVAQ